MGFFLSDWNFCNFCKKETYAGTHVDYVRHQKTVGRLQNDMTSYYDRTPEAEINFTSSRAPATRVNQESPSSTYQISAERGCGQTKALMGEEKLQKWKAPIQ